MLILPTARLIREFANLRDPLPEIIGEIHDLYFKWWSTTREQTIVGSLGLCVSSIYRTPAEDRALGASGIHSSIPHRAIDIPMPWKRVSKLAMVVNRRWLL